MGNSCGCGKDQNKLDVNKLIVIQNLWRRKKAMRTRDEIREQKMKDLFSN